MSPTFLRTWYQISGTSLAAALSSSSRMMSDSPGFEWLRVHLKDGVSCSFFSMRSVICRSTCSAVAPGHSVRITMARKAKSGSSRWPRLKNAAMPPSAMTIRKNSVSCRYFSAAAERLNSLFIQDPHALPGPQQLRAGGHHDIARRETRLDDDALAGDAAGLHGARLHEAGAVDHVNLRDLAA